MIKTIHQDASMKDTNSLKTTIENAIADLEKADFSHLSAEAKVDIDAQLDDIIDLFQKLKKK